MVIPEDIDELLGYDIVWYRQPTGQGFSTAIGMRVVTLEPEAGGYTVVYRGVSRVLAVIPPAWRFGEALPQGVPIAERASAFAFELMRALGPGQSTLATRTLAVKDIRSGEVRSCTLSAAGATLGRPCELPVQGYTDRGNVIWTFTEDIGIWTANARKLELDGAGLRLGFATLNTSEIAAVEAGGRSVSIVTVGKNRIVVVERSVDNGAAWPLALARDLSSWLMVELIDTGQ